MIELREGARMGEYQDYIERLETLHGWLDVDLVHNCFLMGEEVGELFHRVSGEQSDTIQLPFMTARGTDHAAGGA